MLQEGGIKVKERGKECGMKFWDGRTAVVSPGVGLWGVELDSQASKGFQGASRASSPDPPIC